MKSMLAKQECIGWINKLARHGMVTCTSSCQGALREAQMHVNGCAKQLSDQQHEEVLECVFWDGRRCER